MKRGSYSALSAWRAEIERERVTDRQGRTRSQAGNELSH